MFEILFTLYLNDLNVSLYTMGVIFSVSGVISFLVLVILGTQSDVWGRKVVYSASLLIASISSFFTSMLKNLGELTIAQITWNFSLKSRAAVHPTFIFETVRKGYARIIARIQGIELTLNATGFTVAGSVLLYLGFQRSFLALSLVLLGSFVVFLTVREPSRPKVERKSIREMYSFDISRQLKIICVYNLIFGIGFAVCHSVFIYTLFFLKKFAVDPITLSLILGIHHFGFGLTLIFVSRLFGKPSLNLKKVLISSNLLFGLSYIVTALIPSLITAYAVWLLHNILGSAFYYPTQQTLTQNFSRDDTRGKDVNMTAASMSIGQAIGPIIGGYLAEIDISLPFIVGGIIVALGSLILIPLDQGARSS